MPYHAIKFEENPWSKSLDKDFHNFGTQFAQNCPFDQKDDLSRNFTEMTFIYLLCLIMLQGLKKFFEGILQYKVA